LVSANGWRNPGRKALIVRKKPKRKSLRAKIAKEKVSHKLKKILAGEILLHPPPPLIDRPGSNLYKDEKIFLSIGLL
jgi:hypothetical protein